MRERPLVLLVDDEDDFLEILKIKLEAAGFEVAIAHNGAEGVAAAKKLMPDIVLMDINMPGETGTDAALTIKQDPATHDIKIAFLTSLRDPWPTLKSGNEEITKEIGIEAFFEKTDDLDLIAKRVKMLLQPAS
jgi:CheY-like chemotaxis protein